MSHRAINHEPEFFHKMLSEEDVRTKNIAELSRYTGITDASRLTKIFSSVDPDEVFRLPVSVHENTTAEFKAGEFIDDPIPEKRSYRMAEFKTFSMMDVHDRSCVLAVGSRESGKTVTMYQLVATKSYFPDAYATSTTDGVSGYWQSVIPPKNVHLKYDPAFQNAIIDAQAAVTDKFKERLAHGEFYDPRVLVVEEDCSYDMFLKLDRALDRMATSGRHYHALPIVLVQRVNTVDTVFRENCDLLFLWKSDNKKTRTIIWEEYASFMPKDEFFNIWDRITGTPYTVMVICSRGRDRFKPVEERIFWFRGYKEEAVDALMGEGEINDKGEVTKPPKWLWRIGRPWLLNPVIKQEAEQDDVALTRGRIARQVRVQYDKADDEEEDNQNVRFEKSAFSWSDRVLTKYRVNREKKNVAAIDHALKQGQTETE